MLMLGSDLLYTCDCGSFSIDSDAHDFMCALWNSVAFCQGDALWAGDKLIPIADIEPEILEVEHLPLIDIDCSEKDALEIVLADLGIEDVDLYNTAVETLPTGLYQVLDLLALREPLIPEDHRILEDFAKILMPDASKEDLAPLYDCLCSTKTHVLCETCGVYRPDGKPDSKWVPMFERRLRELKMFFEEKVYECTCKDAEKMYVCSTCKVQRWLKGMPWMYWKSVTSTGTGKLWGDETGKSKTQPAISSGSTVYSGFGVQPAKTWVQKCRHYGEVVDLPDGTKIMCSSHHATSTREPEEYPDFGCYMAVGSWKPNWRSYMLPWADYGEPEMSMDVVDIYVDDLLALARGGQTVEIGCIGGHGRTGSLLALMCLKAGSEDADAAIDYVQTVYCEHAIEGAKQEWYIAAYDAMLKGVEAPPRPVTPCSWWKHGQMFDGKDKPCDPKCPDYDDDMIELAEKAKTKNQNGSAKSAPAKGKVTEIKSKKVEATPSEIYRVPTWDTPVPEPEKDWCSSRRHYILWWRHEVCEVPECQYWDTDLETYAKEKPVRAPVSEVIQRLLDSNTIPIEEKGELLQELSLNVLTLL